jgi:hypothetical protein
MGAILSREEFSNTLRGQRGMTPENVAESLRLYDGAARASSSALPDMPNLGFFSSQTERIGAFISSCKHLDKLVEQGKISTEEAIIAISLMAFSDKNFFKAARAFLRWGVPRYRDDLTTDSEIADYYLRNTAVSY